MSKLDWTDLDEGAVDAARVLAMDAVLEIGVVLMTVDEDLVNRYGHNH